MAKLSDSKQVKSRYSRRIRHGDSDAHDLYLSTRKTSRLLLDDLSSLWGGNADAQERLALFLLYNKESFSFLSIDVWLAEDGTPALIFHPSEKVGCAPLFSPVNGKVCASIIVNGSLDEDISEILPLIEGDIEISFSDRLILPYKTSLKPPMYFECAKFIDQYIKAQTLRWKRFVSEVKVEQAPSSSTQWTKYASKCYDPHEILRYPNKKNLLSSNHPEWRELNYVLKMCLDELSDTHIPRTSQLAYKEKVEDLRRKIDFTSITKPTELRVRASEPLDIKNLKLIGNRIINSITSEYRAWSVDFSKLFERYVQYVFKLVAVQIGGQLYCNNKFAVSGTHRSWTLSYLEPDIIIRKGDRVLVADAKYKMNMLNAKAESVDSLKEAFRHDLHQVLGYSSFERDVNKTSLLVYPSKTFTVLHQKIRSTILAVTNDIYLIGIPWGECKNGNSTISINQKITAAVNGLMQIICP